MKANQAIALAALAFEGAQAVPTPGQNHAGSLKHAHLHHKKRDIVWETKWEIETITLVRTVYADGSSRTTAPVATVTSSKTSAPASYVPSPSETGAPAPLPAPVQSKPSTYVPPPTTSVTPVPAPQTTAKTQAPAPAPVTTQAPAPSPSPYVAPAPAPAPTSEPAKAPAPAPSSAAPAASPTASPAASSGGSYSSSGSGGSGDATYYDIPAGAYGACGDLWDGTPVVAISHALYDANKGTTNGGQGSTLCGQMINIKGLDGDTYQAKVFDRCGGCDLPYSLDMDQDLFNGVTNNGDGRVHNIAWSLASSSVHMNPA